MQKPDKFIPALYGGLIIGFISAVPILQFVNCFCCAGVLAGGFLSVFFYKSNFTPDTPPYTSGDCLAVGAIAGVIGAVVSTLLTMMFLAMFGDVAREFLLKFLENPSLQIPEEALQQIRTALEEAPGGVASVVIDLISGLILYPIFGLLGGLIGYAVWKPAPAASPGAGA